MTQDLTGGRLVAVVVLLGLLTACGAATGDQAASHTSSGAGLGPVEGGRELDRVSVLPEEAESLPVLAPDPESAVALTAAAVALGADPDALAGLGADELLVAFDLGECTQGEAVLVLDEAELSLDGRTSDGVCEAIDHEVQLWAVPWSSLPPRISVGAAFADRP